MMGKHYRISCPGNATKRYYTISNCMRAEVYNEYLKAIEAKLSGQKVVFNRELVSSSNQSGSLQVTVKSYKMKGGLSRVMKEAQPDTPFEVKGPMGRGLDIQREGVHLAFA